jgi:hypothetical protein
MAIFEIEPQQIRKIEETTFSAAGIQERADLQRLLRDHIEIVSKDILVIAEEFCEWEDAKRRIDLLAINKNGDLVVIELKRTEDGGHMDLQAIRYAAMVSAMTFDKVIEVFAEYLAGTGCKSDARTVILNFLGLDEPNEDQFAQDVRIILVSAEFSKELTTAVMWMNDHGIDIRCIRMKPYADNGRTLVEIQQVIPLPEAKDYLVKIREKEGMERQARESGRDYTKYTLTINGKSEENLSKRTAALRIVTHLCLNGVSPEEIAEKLAAIRTNAFQIVEGDVDSGKFQTMVESRLRSQNRNFDPSRWFCEQTQLIRFKGNTYALTNQWGGRASEIIAELTQQYPQAGIHCESC